MLVTKKNHNIQKTWCIYGAGRAGKARLRSGSSLSRWVQVSLISSRSQSLRRSLCEDQFDGVVLCTENNDHFMQIKEAIQHSMNVIVEYPIANRFDEAQILYKLAEARNRRIHCQHIGLLKPSHQWLKSYVESNCVSEVKVNFNGGVYRWVKKAYLAHQAAVLAVGRLQVLWDLFGPLSLKSANYSDLGDGYRLVVNLVGNNGENIHLEEQRRPGLKRATQWEYIDDSKGQVEVPESSSKDLYLSDWKRALKYFETGQNYLYPEAVLGVLSLVSKIEHYLGWR
jgi:hypothetical protein